MLYHVTIRAVGKDHTAQVEAESTTEAIQKACAEVANTNPEILRLTCQFKVRCLG